MKKYKFILVTTCLFILAGCSSFKRKFPTYNKGAYTVTLGQYESKSEDDMVTIRGHVFDMKTGKSLHYAVASAGCFKFLTTDEGEYSFKTRNLKTNFSTWSCLLFPIIQLRRISLISITERK
ncbi:hypothetical protein [Flavobacterium chilense]|uniref:Uncharacterized protein n=1 Tax=Flavobacterium chilense TaxID=946677 RepID=A0A1M7J8Z4_9FLAO|nr:hypothetical protein [Flavobacterium chilense]SHM49550.1 hypothetical protein SAMN05444484_106230 [Flavobacterium chilense]